MSTAEKLALIRAECRKAIELGENATAGPWEQDRTCFKSLWTTNNLLVVERCNHPGDLQFVAHSRTFSPIAAKAALWMMDALEEHRKYLDQAFCGCTTAIGSAGDRDVCGRCIALDNLETALQSLADQWPTS